MGSGLSKGIDKVLHTLGVDGVGVDQRALLNVGERDTTLVGLRNVGNTCYLNSTLQALAHSRAFVEALRQRDAIVDDDVDRAVIDPMLTKENRAALRLYTELRTLLLSLSASRASGTGGSGSTHELIRHLPSTFELGRQQDAHEFVNFVTNAVNDAELAAAAAAAKSKHAAAPASNSESENVDNNDANTAVAINGNDGDGDTPKRDVAGVAGVDGDGDRDGNNAKSLRRTLMQNVFGGVISNETRCLTCDSVTRRDESFLDLSLDMVQFASLSECMRRLSSTELLSGENKYHCARCRCLQEARRTRALSSAPRVLVLQLKRFRVDYQADGRQRIVKLRHALVFSLRMVVPTVRRQSRRRNRRRHGDDAESTAAATATVAVIHSDDGDDEGGDVDDSTTTVTDVVYMLSAVVVHIGKSATSGHYVCVARVHGGDADADGAVGGGDPEGVDGRWALFNDGVVTRVDDIRRTLQLLSGAPSGDADNDVLGRATAYILVYERDDSGGDGDRFDS